MPKLYPAVLEYRADPDRELIFAAVTAPAEVCLPIANLGVLHLVHVQIATTRAGRMIAPPLRFHELHSGFLVRASRWECSYDYIVFGRAVLYFGIHD